MKEHPLVCTTSVVQAILAGRQTQDRRLLKPQPKGDTITWGCTGGIGFGFTFDGGLTRVIPKYAIGDRLWIKEAWFPAWLDKQGKSKVIVYKSKNPGFPFKWKSPRSMLKKYALLWLDVAGLRYERLQNITEEDARAEGVIPFTKPPCDAGDCWTDGKYKTAFEYLWNECYGWHPNAWESNPWVQVTEFRKLAG
jgi:hypothetical protein